MTGTTFFKIALAAAGMCAAGARAAADGTPAWAWMPPPHAPTNGAAFKDPMPRVWSGQQASLAWSEARTEGTDAVTLTWERAAREVDPRATLPGDPRSLWRGRTPPKPLVTEPVFHTVGRDLRLFTGLPETPAACAERLPVVIVTDGNDEDGFGGWLLALDTDAAWTCARAARAVTLRTSDGRARRAFAARFDGRWTAGLSALARHAAELPAVAAAVEAKRRELVAGARGPAPDAELLLHVIAEWAADDGKMNAPAAGWDAWLRARMAARAETLADPRLAATFAKGILFCTRRNPSWNHCVAQYFGWRQRPGGAVRVLEEPGRSMRTRDLTAGRFPRGSFLEPRVDYDARRVVFAFVETDGPGNPYTMKVNEAGPDEQYYHIHTMDADGGNLRKITAGVYEDLMPEWLPDGDVVFMSSRRRSQSRCFWSGYSNRWQAYTLFRMKADGTGMKQLSWNDVSEWFPCMNNDGELIFARWDYIDRDAVRHQNLWSMRPDGTNPKAVWGNETTDPHCTFQARPVPGSGKIACVASAHHAVTGGPLILIDPAVDENSEAAITHVTPGHYPEIDMKFPAESTDPRAGNDWYNSPWPYGEDLFLVSWTRTPLQYEPSRPNPDTLALYVLRAEGGGRVRRELLYRDPALNVTAAQPLVPRARPPMRAQTPDAALAAADKGEVFIADVYRGLTNAPRGSLARVRVVQIFPRTQPDQYEPLTGSGGHENARAVLGTARVEADGSARFLVPACKPLLFQVLTDEGAAWRTMRSTTSLMPGERVSCVGCHEAKREVSAAAANRAAAMRRPAEELAASAESGRPWGFTEHIQPILDAKCAACHSGETPPRGVFLARGTDTRFDGASGGFSRAYASLIFTDEPTGEKQKGLLRKFRLWKRRTRVCADGTTRPMVPCWPEYNLVQTTPEGPGVNWLGSGLRDKLSHGKHGALLTPEERRLFAVWIDLNALFFGCYDEPDLGRQREGQPISMPERQ